jgi:hypothetical protein
MNLEHIDPGEVIEETAELYKKMQMDPIANRHISRQIQALTYVLTEKVNNVLLDIENASE